MNTSGLSPSRAAAVARAEELAELSCGGGTRLNGDAGLVCERAHGEDANGDE